MPDSSDNALPYVEYDNLKYGKLSVTDRTLLLREFKKQAKADLLESIKASGLGPEQTYAELRSFDLEVWGARRWLEYVNSWEGQQNIFRQALAKYQAAEKIDQLLSELTLTPAESIERACVLSCLPYDQPKPNVPANMVQIGTINGAPVYMATDGQKPEGDSANPTGNPPAYGKQTE